MPRLTVVLLKPSKYDIDGNLETFRWGFMPNSTLPYLRGLTPPNIDGFDIDCIAVDECVQCDCGYLEELKAGAGERKLVCLVGVQSHQMHRALDLAAFAVANGSMALIGGPHVMTCDTAELHDRGVSFCVAEADLVWDDILRDACRGSLAPLYGESRRWQPHLKGSVALPPSRQDLKRYVVPMLGLYPARGCPFSCNFCSVVKIAGHRIRSQPVDVTMASMRAAKAAGVRQIMITSDNFNKYPDASNLLQAMIDERIDIPFFVQCDTQLGRQPKLLDLLSKAGCQEIFLGVECFDRQTLVEAGKRQNRPEVYGQIAAMCRDAGISSHFSNIIGFPSQDRAAVREHLAHLKEIGPTWASFYILCPIPGTDQYASFKDQGIITEKNLDRFDATCLTWAHPHFGNAEIKDLLFECYRSFSSWSHAFRNAFTSRTGIEGRLNSIRSAFGNTIFNRVCALKRMHPMSGGFLRQRIQNMRDFLPLRRSHFGIDLLPLPRNLEVPEHERLANARLRATGA